MSEPDLTADQLKALRRAAAGGEYHLLLGAGASLDSVSTKGQRLPSGGELAGKLAVEFDVPIEEGDLLWRIYARVVDKAGEERVYDWLRRLFHGVHPPDWMEKFASFPWECVWTLNLDDSFEQAFRKVKTEVSRNERSVNWDDQYRTGRGLDIVHLHGKVDQEEPQKLIFSLTEYATAAVSRAAWPVTFRDQYGVKPIVIIGARLRDEPDIEAIVARRSPVQEAPSLYISPGITDVMAQDLMSWNLIPIRMTAERFADTWAELTGFDLSLPPAPRDELAMRVARQFKELRTDRPRRVPQSHDFHRWGRADMG
ncbi:MAG TPA: hypothetical protein DGT23_28150 [Micromonosporaceae bacterium]|nr:hypothetical protein [Micromonosporaceae bacterium]